MTHRTMFPPRKTPWGTLDYEREIAPGIWTIGTASHGGIWLRYDKRWQRGKAWYEEDCEVAIVVTKYPEPFTAGQILGAKLTMERWFPDMKINPA